MNRAQKRAQDILKELHIERPPVPIEQIAKIRGIQIRLVALDEELSGMIYMDDNIPIVVINSLHHSNRRRFTLAHEIGHFELHLKKFGEQVHVDKKFWAYARDKNSSAGENIIEIEANQFAAEILVPRSFLIKELRGKIIDLENESLVGDLARQFQVSSQMMTFRVRDLLDM
jgi:Zn-dependent peptidase ImmA (M78 family)